MNENMNQYMIEWLIQEFEHIATDDGWALDRVLIMHVS